MLVRKNIRSYTNKVISQLMKEKKELEEKIKNLEKDLETFKQISQTLKQQYIILNQDFENYKKRIQDQKKELEEKLLIDIVNKIIPLIENLRLSIENIPEDIKNHKWVEGIKLTYQNLLKIIEKLGVFQKHSIGEQPNEIYHEPIGMIETDEKNKGKIVAEQEKCYIYKKGDKEIVIKPAKVVIGK